MALTITEGHPIAVPVYFESWDEWRRERRDATPLPPAPLAAAGTSSCPLCWNQRVIWEPARNGEGLVPVRCTGCGGSGLTSRPL